MLERIDLHILGSRIQSQLEDGLLFRLSVDAVGNSKLVVYDCESLRLNVVHVVDLDILRFNDIADVLLDLNQDQLLELSLIVPTCLSESSCSVLSSKSLRYSLLENRYLSPVILD